MDLSAFGRDGYAITPGFVGADVARALHERALALDVAGTFAAAGVGRGAAHAVRSAIRGDRIAWIDAASPAEAERPLLDALGSLQASLNEAFYLGLWDLEAHYAVYAPGSVYARHRDRFAGDDAGGASRVVSFVVYLNERWQPAHGGALRLYVGAERHVDVMPESGTLACFLAERFEHEVLPATRPRSAVTGWFRRRAI